MDMYGEWLKSHQENNTHSKKYSMPFRIVSMLKEPIDKLQSLINSITQTLSSLKQLFNPKTRKICI